MRKEVFGFLTNTSPKIWEEDSHFHVENGALCAGGDGFKIVFEDHREAWEALASNGLIPYEMCRGFQECNPILCERSFVDHNHGAVRKDDKLKLWTDPTCMETVVLYAGWLDRMLAAEAVCNDGLHQIWGHHRFRMLFADTESRIEDKFAVIDYTVPPFRISLLCHYVRRRNSQVSESHFGGMFGVSFEY